MNRIHPQKSVVILGAGYAGLLAAYRLARRAPGTSITLVNATDHFVERVRLHQLVSGERVPVYPLATLLRGTPIRFVQGQITTLEPDHKQIVLADGQRLNYDQLIYALGSRIDRDSVPGVRENAMTVEDGLTVGLKLAALAHSKGRVLVVGGGLTGIELATEIAERWPALCVDLVTSGVFGSNLSRGGTVYLRRVFARLRITLHEGVPIQRLEAGRAILNDQMLPFDLCLWNGGFSVPDLARRAGLRTNIRDQVIVDPMLRSVSHPDIFAVGDSASLREAADLPLRMACATAMPMGAHASDNVDAVLSERGLAPFGFGFIFRCISLGRRRGLVQWVQPDDTPRALIQTGWVAALIKELIVRYTIASLRLEKRFGPVYVWPRGRRAQQRTNLEVLAVK